MRKLMTLGALGGTAAAATIALAATAGPGAKVDVQSVAGTSAEWRISSTPDANARLNDVAVDGKKDAWAVGFQSSKSTSLPLVRHWDGKSWKKVGALTTRDVYLGSVSASSPSNVWITGVRSPGGKTRYYLLHWNGHRWSTQVSSTPKNALNWGAGRLLALGPKDVWRFITLDTEPSLKADVRHFDGKRWVKVKAPVPIAGASAVSGRDIWATGASCIGAACGKLVHWNGKNWSTSNQPPTTGNSSAYYGSAYSGIVARSAKNVWVIGTANTKSGSGSKTIFLHWNGKSWKQFPVPADNPQWRDLTDDGAGGFWATSIYPTRSLYHYSAGTWTRIPQPSKAGLVTEIKAIDRVPGTTSLWGVGALDDDNLIDKTDAIFSYGR